MGGARLADAGGNVLAGVEVTCVNALPPKVPWVADAGVCAPVVAAVAVLRADVRVTGVSQVTAVLYMNLKALQHVHVDHVGGRLTHTHTLYASGEAIVDVVPHSW